MLVIGDEILSGKVRDTNASLVLSELRDLGVRLKGIFVVPDELDTIAGWIRLLKGRYTYLLTSGGVGPTHDDVTMAGIARGLGRPLVRSQELLDDLATVYGRALNAPLAKMADVPSGSELLRDRALEVPVTRVDEIFIFPGEPNLFRKKFLAIRERFRSTPFHLARIYTLADEGEIAMLMEEAQSRFQVSVGSYPVYDNPEYRVQITIESKVPERVREAAEFIAEGIPQAELLRVELPAA
jgi:molybdopterin-biosynthesis enzyme MoeA-like protein